MTVSIILLQKRIICCFIAVFLKHLGNLSVYLVYVFHVFLMCFLGHCQVTESVMQLSSILPVLYIFNAHALEQKSLVYILCALMLARVQKKRRMTLRLAQRQVHRHLL
jgi:hypothetical protein